MREQLTTIEWPVSTLGCPLRSRWNAEVAPRFLASQEGLGPTQYRGENVEEKVVHTLVFIWSLSQLAAWESFCEYDLLGGMRWFRMTIDRERYCHLIEEVNIQPLAERLSHYTVSMAVETYGKVRAP